MSAGTESSAEGAVIALPKGGGAVGGLGEKFTAAAAALAALSLAGAFAVAAGRPAAPTARADGDTVVSQPGQNPWDIDDQPATNRYIAGVGQVGARS